VSGPEGAGGAVDAPVISCVGAVIRDARGRIVLVQRGREPGMGLWSVPGGRVEPGESDEAAVVREVVEETGLRVRVLRHVGTVTRAAPGGGTYLIRDYLAEPVGGPADRARDPVAGDDADDARWATRAELASLPLVPGLVDALDGWAVLPEG
jgi:8-oxo-dGTP diphosphatase